MTNIQMVLLFMLLVVLCLIAAGCSQLWSSSNDSIHWYLKNEGNEKQNKKKRFYIIKSSVKPSHLYR